MDQNTLEYFTGRERQERAAAKNASGLPAPRVHQELAQHYAAVVQGTAEVRRADAPHSRLTIMDWSQLG
jgi:hypothetical protein